MSARGLAGEACRGEARGDDRDDGQDFGLASSCTGDRSLRRVEASQTRRPSRAGPASRRLPRARQAGRPRRGRARTSARAADETRGPVGHLHPAAAGRDRDRRGVASARANRGGTSVDARRPARGPAVAQHHLRAVRPTRRPGRRGSRRRRPRRRARGRGLGAGTGVPQAVDVDGERGDALGREHAVRLEVGVGERVDGEDEAHRRPRAGAAGSRRGRGTTPRRGTRTRSSGTSIVRSGLKAVGTPRGTLKAGVSVSRRSAKLHASCSVRRARRAARYRGLSSTLQVKTRPSRKDARRASSSGDGRKNVVVTIGLRPAPVRSRSAATRATTIPAARGAARARRRARAPTPATASATAPPRAASARTRASSAARASAA